MSATAVLVLLLSLFVVLMAASVGLIYRHHRGHHRAPPRARVHLGKRRHR